MTNITDNGFARITKETIVRNPDTPWALTWNDIAYNNTTTLNEKLLSINGDFNVVLNWTTFLTLYDKAYIRIPAEYNWMELTYVSWVVWTWLTWKSTSWWIVFTITNLTKSHSMLTTNLSIDYNEYSSATATSQVIIDTNYDNVDTNDVIEIACTACGTWVTFSTITLTFARP